VTATMSSPYYMVVVLWRRWWQHTISFSFFLFFWGPFGLIYENWQLTMK
jgi:hypothetical protein